MKASVLYKNGDKRTKVATPQSLQAPRLAIYAHFGQTAKVKLYVLHYLTDLIKLGFEVCFVSNSPVSPESQTSLLTLCNKFIQRENTGFDFAMWKEALAQYDLSKYEELLLTNSSIIGPLKPIAALWQNRMVKRCDFWGLTDNLELGHHLQSYFLVFRRNVLQSASFKNFWLSVLPLEDKQAVIRNYEIGLTRWLQDAGFKWKAVFPHKRMWSIPLKQRSFKKRIEDWYYNRSLPAGNTTLLLPDILLQCGMPFLKVALLRDSPEKSFELLEASNLPSAMLEELRSLAPCSPAIKSPSVSICVPTYNGREHLSELIESILAQTFKDFEVVLCDDQSTDGTLDYARDLAKGDDRFRFISNPCRYGLVGNWNNCVRAARGEWIKFVFQDDIIAPQCVEKLLQACKQSGKPFAFCAREFIFEDGVTPSLVQWFNDHQGAIDAMYGKNPVIEAEQAIQVALDKPYYNIVGEPTLTLIRKSAFEEVGLFDDAMIQLCDAEFWFRIMTNCGAAWVPERLASFRVHAKAATLSNLSQRRFRLEVLDPLVVAYRFAFDRHFSLLRAAKSPGKSSYSLWKQCAALAYRARQEAKRPATAGSSAGNNRMKDWNDLVLFCPKLRGLARMGEALEHYALVKRAVRKLGKSCLLGLRS